MHAKSKSAAKLPDATAALTIERPLTNHRVTVSLAAPPLHTFQRRFAEGRAKVVASPDFVDRLRSVPKAREVLGGISHGKFYNEVAAGRLPLTKIGARSFVAASDLAAYLAASRQPFSAEEVA